MFSEYQKLVLMIKSKNTIIWMIGEFKCEPKFYAPSYATSDMHLRLSHLFI